MNLSPPAFYHSSSSNSCNSLKASLYFHSLYMSSKLLLALLLYESISKLCSNFKLEEVEINYFLFGISLLNFGHYVAQGQALDQIFQFPQFLEMISVSEHIQVSLYFSKYGPRFDQEFAIQLIHSILLLIYPIVQTRKILLLFIMPLQIFLKIFSVLHDDQINPNQMSLSLRNNQSFYH